MLCKKVDDALWQAEVWIFLGRNLSNIWNALDCCLSYFQQGILANIPSKSWLQGYSRMWFTWPSIVGEWHNVLDQRVCFLWSTFDFVFSSRWGFSCENSRPTGQRTGTSWMRKIIGWGDLISNWFGVQYITCGWTHNNISLSIGRALKSIYGPYGASVTASSRLGTSILLLTVT